MVAIISRPSALAMARGPGASTEVGRIFWPSAAEAVSRHTATKMDRPVILLSLADRGESRAGHAAKTTPSNGTGPLFLRCAGKKSTGNFETGNRQRATNRRGYDVCAI